MTSVDAAPARGSNLRGIAAITAGMAFLVSNDITLKLASPNLPFGQMVFIRGVMATALIVAVCLAAGVLGRWRGMFTWPVVTRSLANLGSTFFYINALLHLPIANLTSIMQATPLLLTALAALLLREPVGWRRWLAIVVGFCGVLLIVRPDASGFNTYAVFGIVAIGFVAARDLSTRVVKSDVPSLMVTLATSLSVTIAAGVYSCFEGWAEVQVQALGFIAISAVCLVCGYHMVVVAFRSGEVAVVSPFRFSIVVWALLGGYLIWGEVPDATTLAGIALVISMGLYTFHRERVRPAEQPAAAVAPRRDA